MEASLIVGIIAALLSSHGRRDALRQVWLGVGVGVVLCLLIGIGLVTLSRELPQRQQEQMETVIGLFAVVMVTFMILWMNRHARGMKKELEGAAANALAQGSARALVAMAFLAVLREGFETAVFLVSVVQNSTSATTGAFGALLGIVIAVGIGFGIYKGGIRINLGRFFMRRQAGPVAPAAPRPVRSPAAPLFPFSRHPVIPPCPKGAPVPCPSPPCRVSCGPAATWPARRARTTRWWPST